MKSVIFLAAFLATIFLVSTPVRADGMSPNDPRMIPMTGAAGGCGSIPITLEPFTFSVDVDGNSDPTEPGAPSQQCFLNSGTAPISSLTVTTMDPPGQGSPCISDSYNFANSPLFSQVACSFNSQAGLLTVRFSGTGNFEGANYPGVAVGTDFYMDLAGWNSNESFTGTANVGVPEPSSLMLLGLGLSTMVAFGSKKFAGKTI
jgi:hypothetical protein